MTDKTLADLESKYTGAPYLKIRTIGDTVDYDFEWIGNDYVIVPNVYLEDSDPKWVQFDSVNLIFDGYVHRYRCALIATYPELDCRVFQKMAESIKEGAIW